MGCANLYIENFSTPSLDLFVLLYLFFFINLYLHWHVKIDIETRVPISDCWHLNKPLSFLPAPVSWALLFWQVARPAFSYSGNLWFIASRTEAQVTTCTCYWLLKWRQSCGTDTLTCGIWHYLWVVRIELNLQDTWSASAEKWGIAWCVKEKWHILDPLVRSFFSALGNH